MHPLPITHIGVLVANLETARQRWSCVTGFPFSPISRYRPPNWRDFGNAQPHLHDARLSFCLGDGPSIELLEFVGNGTHSPDKGEGGHHLAFPPVADNEARRRELAALGIRIDGEFSLDDRQLLQFAEAEPLDNVYTEWVEEHPAHPDVKDDLSPVNRLPDGTKTLFDVETILALNGQRPQSGIAEFGVAVSDLARSVAVWSAVTGYSFDKDTDSAVSAGPGVAVRLVQVAQALGRPGLYYATIRVPDLAATLTRLHADGVPARTDTDREKGLLVEVDPAYLNGISIRFTEASAR